MEARIKGRLAALLGVVLALGLHAGTCRMALASGGGTTTEPVPYLAWTGTELVEKTGDDACKDYELVTKKTTTLGGDKWYVVQGDVYIWDQLTVTGDVNLILCDGAELYVNEGIRGGTNTVSVYAQSEGNPGTLSIEGVNGHSSTEYGEPGKDGDLAMEGNLVVYGGNIHIRGGYGGDGCDGENEENPDGSDGGNGGGGLKGDLTLYAGSASVSGGYFGSYGYHFTEEWYWDDELGDFGVGDYGSNGIDGDDGFGIDGSVTVHNYAAFHNGRVDIEGGDGDSDVVCSGLTVGENLDVENEYGLTTEPYRLGCSELHVFPARVRSITFNPNPARVNADETVELTATVTEKAVNKDLVWSSSNSSHASVTVDAQDSHKCTVSGIVPDGSITITATAADAGGYRSRISVPVIGGSLKVRKDVTVNGESTTTTLADGTYTFHITGTRGQTVDDAEVTITNGSSNEVQVNDLLPDTYTVTEDEVNVPAGMELVGSASQTVSVAVDNELDIPTAEFTNNKVYVAGVSLSPDAPQIVNAGEKVELTAAIEPDSLADKTVVWGVGGTDEGAVELYSDEECETPLELGEATDVLTVYARGVAAGTAAVTATSNADSTKSASCDVTVRKEQTIAADDVEATYGDKGRFVSATTDGDGAISYAVKAGSKGCVEVDAQTGALTIKGVGTAYVTVTAEVTATYAAASKDVAVTIGRADLSGAEVTLKRTSYVYDGTAKEPGVRSVVLDGRRLKAGTDYTVSYRNNTQPGTATVTFKGTGNYRGSAKATFSIALAKVRGLSTAGHPAIGALDASWRAVAGATSYELSWRRAGGEWKSKSVKGASAAVEGLKTNGLYEVRVRAKVGSATGEWSKSASRWLRKVSSLKAAAGSAEGSIKVSWAADDQATGGYVVRVCSKKDGAAVAKKVVAAGKTSATISGLKSGKAYYVKVRPLRKASGATYVGVQRYYKTTVKAG